MDSNFTNKIKSRLERIANVLIVNASFIDNLGFLNGKMGIALFFYEYSKYTNNDSFSIYADKLIDEIYEGIGQGSTQIDFANGLTGIGWGMGYLLNNGFVDGDADVAFDEIDNVIFREAMQNPISIHDQNSLFGLGLYYLSRIRGHENDDENIENLKKKQFLIYLMDECERLLTKELLFEIPVPNWTLYQINSLMWFIFQTRKIGLFPLKSDKLILFLENYINLKMVKAYDPIDKTIFCSILNELIPLISDSVRLKKYKELSSAIFYKRDEKSNGELLINQFIKSSWCPLIYNMSLKDPLIVPNQMIFEIIEDEKIWYKRIENLETNNMGLFNGMAGLGLALIKELLNSTHHKN